MEVRWIIDGSKAPFLLYGRLIDAVNIQVLADWQRTEYQLTIDSLAFVIYGHTDKRIQQTIDAKMKRQYGTIIE